MNNLVVAIVGPTASGKTALSIELSKRLNGQVICCDSRTVYRYMDIGTAKPTVAEQQEIQHHMLDIVTPDQTYTVARFANDAEQTIALIQNAGALPVMCGGTGLYFRAALEGLKIPEVPPNAELRQHLNQMADRNGNSALHTQLAKLDPASADRIHVNDRFRLVRALEVSLSMGAPFSRLARLEPPPYNVLWIGLSAEDRSVLQARIHSRLEAQLKAGLLAEVSSLYDRYGNCAALMNTINYSEFIPYLTGQATPVQAQEICLRNNYQLARRQIMWFKRSKNISWFFIDRQDPQAVLCNAAELVSARLKASKTA